MEITGELRDWYVDSLFNNIVGYIYNDTRGRFYDGELIHTSSVPQLKPQELKEGSVVNTLNSSYLLGAPANKREGVKK